MIKVILRQLGFFSLLATAVHAFNYEISDPGYLVLDDVATGIPSIVTIFTNEEFNVTVEGIAWAPVETANNQTSSDILFWTTTINGAVAGRGNISLLDYGSILPSSIEAGTYLINKKGTATIVVTFSLDDVDTEASGSYQVFAAGLSIMPLVVVLVFALTTRMVRKRVLKSVLVNVVYRFAPTRTNP